MRTVQRVLVLGATGAVGSEIVRQCLLEPRFERVVAMGRRELGIAHSRLESRVHRDFSDFTPLEGLLAEIDVCLCALGISAVTESDPTAYHRITHDYPLAAARSLDRANPAARFLFVSAREVDPRSRRRHVRVKGETERDLRGLLGERLVVYRPGYVSPSTPRSSPAWQDQLFGPFMFLRPLLPAFVTDTLEVAHAMIEGALEGATTAVVDNRSIHAAALTYRARRERPE